MCCKLYDEMIIPPSYVGGYKNVLKLHAFMWAASYVQNFKNLSRTSILIFYRIWGQLVTPFESYSTFQPECYRTLQSIYSYCPYP